jgi:hypothetical protein
MISGVRTTDLVSSSLIKRDVREAIFNFKPYQTPITQFFMANKYARRPTGNPKFEIQEDILVPHRTSVTTGPTASNTSQDLTVPAGEGLYFKAGDVIRIHATNENALVTASASTTISILPLDGSGGTAFTANTGTSVISRASSAYAEGTASPVAKSTQGTFPWNYAQILKQSVNLTGTQQATQNYGGSDWTNQRVKATEEFKLDIERMSVFGIRNVTTTAGAYIRFSAGLLDSNATLGMGIQKRDQFVGNAFATEDEFFKTYCKDLFAKGSNRKTLYCGPDALLGIGDFSKVKQQTRVADKQYGYDITSIITPFGIADLVWHPLLEGSYTNWVIGVDKEDYMRYRFLSGNGVNRDMQYNDNVQTPDSDSRKAYYLAEIGFELAGGSQGVHYILYPGA